MNDEPIILETASDTTATPTRSRFPAVAQFAILTVLLGTLLGGVVFPYVFGTTSQTPLVTLETATTSSPTLAVIDSIEAPAVKARAVYVYDVATERALYKKDADEVLPLASIAKLMTTLVARELVPDDKAVTISNEATVQMSASGLLAGERFKSQALRDYAMLASSNDAAFALAEGVGGELSDDRAYEAFIEAMNITAEELRLDSMRFKNPTGLDISTTEAGAYGSARDVSFLMAYILKNYPDILETTTMSSERVYNLDGAYHEAENTNPAIRQIPNLIGSKTGYTDLAQGNLTIAFDAGYNRPIIITVLGSTFDERFTDTLALVAAVQDAFKTIE